MKDLRFLSGYFGYPFQDTAISESEVCGALRISRFHQALIQSAGND